MGTKIETIREWLKNGQEEKATHVIIACDTFDHEDYPVMVKKGENPKEKVNTLLRKDMTRVMEVYNLNMDIEEQLKPGIRAWNY